MQSYNCKKGGRKELKQQKRENECNAVCCQADRGFVHSQMWGISGGALGTISYGWSCSLAKSPQCVNAPVLPDCVTRASRQSRERQDSVGPTVFDLGMGTSIELPSVMTALPKAEIPVIVGGEVTRWSLELYNHHWDLIRASGS